MSKEVKCIHKIGDKTFLFETYEQPLRTQIKQLKQQLADKDKEIEDLSLQIAEFNSKITQMEEQDMIFHNQLAIQELEKVKDFILENTMLETETAAVLTYIYQQIKELKGE